MAQQGGQRASRMVLVPFPFQGHINPMLQLATILHSKGFSITIVHTEFNSPNPANHPEFTFIPISDNLSQSKVSLGDFIHVLSFLNKNCAKPFEQCMNQMMQDDQIACIVYDSLMYFGQNVADNLKLSGISLRVSAAAALVAFSAFRSPNEQDYISFEDSMSQDKVLKKLNLKDPLESMAQHARDVVSEVRLALTEPLKKCSAIIVNTMDFLEQEILENIKEYVSSAPIFTIGPFHKFVPTISTSLLEEDTNCISWLDKQAPKSVIYVSVGSMATMNENELLETAWGLANSEHPFLWVVRPGLVHGSDCLELLPKSFEEKIRGRGCIVKWAPQKEVLAHGAIGGFWSHCGWNSTLECICEGVPMLCRPAFGDQCWNARYLCDVWKVGLELEGELERGNIERAVRRLMVDTEGKEIRQRAMEFKEKAENCFREGGSSNNSLNELVEKILSFCYKGMKSH